MNLNIYKNPRIKNGWTVFREFYAEQFLKMSVKNNYICFNNQMDIDWNIASEKKRLMFDQGVFCEELYVWISAYLGPMKYAGTIL